MGLIPLLWRICSDNYSHTPGKYLNSNLHSLYPVTDIFKTTYLFERKSVFDFYKFYVTDKRRQFLVISFYNNIPDNKYKETVKQCFTHIYCATPELSQFYVDNLTTKHYKLFIRKLPNKFNSCTEVQPLLVKSLLFQ